MPAALAKLKSAARLAPEDLHFGYVYAVALHSTGKSQEPLAVIDSTLVRTPGDRELIELRAELAAPPTRP